MDALRNTPAVIGPGNQRPQDEKIERALGKIEVGQVWPPFVLLQETILRGLLVEAQGGSKRVI
jgi:hypothetical protein